VACLLPLGVLVFILVNLVIKRPRSLEELDALTDSMRTPIIAALAVLALGTGALLIAWARLQVPKMPGLALIAFYSGGWTLTAASRIGGFPAPVPSCDAGDFGVRDFVHFAVREGLKKNRPDPKLVGDLVSPQHFVHKCIICWGVSNAFSEYATRAAHSGRFPEEIEKDLQSPDRKARLGALEKVVQASVSAALKRLPDEDRKRMQAALEDEKQFSMRLLLQDFNNDFCPSCSGATK
jgi:hypothetical protein